MATTKSNATPETTLPDDNSAGGTSEKSLEYHALIDWIKEKEASNPSLRVIEIMTTDANAPKHERLTYSHPPVVGGVDGFKDSKGNTVLFEG